MLKDIFTLFINHVLLNNPKETTASTYFNLGTNHILNKLGNCEMSQISESELKNHLKAEQNNNLSNPDEKLSTKTMNDLTSLINTFWDFALNNGHITNKISLPISKPPKRKVQIFYESEMKNIENYIIEKSSPFCLAILLCLYAGLRVGEACALKWSDIDLENKLIHIKNTVIRIKDLTGGKAKTKVVIGLVKSPASIRDIPLPDTIIGFLQQMKKDDNDYIATGSIKFMEPRLLQKRYKTLLKKAQVTYKNPHTLRHTFATNAIDKGMSIKALSEILGHADIKTTLNLYVHPSMEQKQKEMNLIYSSK